MVVVVAVAVVVVVVVEVVTRFHLSLTKKQDQEKVLKDGVAWSTHFGPNGSDFRDRLKTENSVVAASNPDAQS